MGPHASCYFRIDVSKLLPLTFPLAYFLDFRVNFRGDGKSEEVGNVLGPEVGGGDGTAKDQDV